MNASDASVAILRGLLIVVVIVALAALVYGVCTAPPARAQQPPPSQQVVDCWGQERTLFRHAVVASEFWGLPKYLLPAIAHVESSWNPGAINATGQYAAYGLMQIVAYWHPRMPGDVFNACDSLNYAGWWLARMLGGGDDPRYLTLPQALDRYSGGAIDYADRIVATMRAMEPSG